MSDLNKLLEQMQRQIMQLEKRVSELESAEYSRFNMVYLADGVDAPSAASGWAIMYVDISDGDLKIIFEDSTIKTITADT